MIIERVLHVRGPKMDFYDSAYFKSWTKTEAVCKDGSIYGYGKALSETYYKIPVYTALASLTELGTDNGALYAAISSNSTAFVSDFLECGELYIYSTDKGKYRQLRCVDCNQLTYILVDNIPGTTNKRYYIPNTTKNPVYKISSYKDPEISDYVLPRVIDLRKFVADHPEWVWGSIIDYDVVKSYFINNPVVPPSQVIVTDRSTSHDPYYMAYWLGMYNGKTPNFIAPHQARWSKPNTISGDDVVFDFEKVIVRTKQTLPFVNGYACFPEVGEDGKLHATNATRYIVDKSVRNRQCVLMDFSPIGDVEFIKMSTVEGDLNKGILLPESYNPKTQSIIVVIDGKIILPDEYSVIGNYILPKYNVLTAIHEADMMFCSGTAYETNGPIIDVNVTRNLKNDENSFFVIIDKPNMQIVQHKAWHTSKERHLSMGSSSYSALHRNTFDQCARGLLFDRTLKAVHDYALEMREVTFYNEEDDKEMTWGSGSSFITNERPIAVLYGTLSNNLMSAKAMLFARARYLVRDDIVMWPNYVILDFIFRG